MNRRSVFLYSALLACASLPASSAVAQYYPSGPQIYRDASPAGRGLPPSWLVDEEQGSARPNGQGVPQAYPQQVVPGYAQPPGGARVNPGQTDASAPPSQDTLRPPAAVGVAPQAAPQSPTATSSLPPEDQPETGEPKALPAQLQRQLVDYTTKEPAGTIIIDTPNTFLYLVLGGGKALRYGIGVGREGFTWTGAERVSRMKEWPDWFPPAEMIERQPYLPRVMAGGNGNPLGARALYLGNTLYRIHGTNQPSTIGQFVSSGCIRLLNQDIEDLYSRVQVGTRVVVLPGGKPPAVADAQPAAPAEPVQVGQRAPSPQGGGVTSGPLPAIR